MGRNRFKLRLDKLTISSTNCNCCCCFLLHLANELLGNNNLIRVIMTKYYKGNKLIS